jgi:probable F420-dependent oxidoreductase
VGGPWATPDNVARVARHAESLGFAGLWVYQRLLYPAAPRNEYYGAPGGRWPQAFESSLDPLVTLAFAAAHTRTIRLGASVLIMPFYSPVVLGKALATLDVLSRGRLDVGLGLGWSLDEYEAVGAVAAERGARADEFLRCLDAVWGDGETEFRGRFYSIPRARIEPKPVQRPRPRLLIGGYSEAVFRRVARADGYAGGNIPLADLARVVGRVHDAARTAHRAPESLAIVCRGAYNVTPAAQGPGRRPLWGSVDEIRQDIGRYEANGVTHLFLDPNFQPQGAALEAVLAQMEALAPAGDGYVR